MKLITSSVHQVTTQAVVTKVILSTGQESYSINEKKPSINNSKFKGKLCLGIGINLEKLCCLDC